MTDKQREHIEQRHPEILKKYEKYFTEIVEKPDYILKDNPNNEFALNKKADISFCNDKIPEALELYEKVLNINENNEDALLGKGICKHKMGDLDEAINNYNKVLNINEENSNALYNKAVAFINKGDKKSVTDLLQKAKNIDDSTYILYAYGLSNLRDGKYDTANELFDLCIQKGINTPEIYHAKGQALYGKGQYEEAYQCVNSAVNSKSNFYCAWNTMANCLDKLGKKDFALQWYKYAAESKPDNALYLTNYCVSLLENGNKEKSKEILNYVESFYQTQKEMFSPDEYEFIENTIKKMNEKLNNDKDMTKVVSSQPSLEVNQDSQGY